MAGQMHVPKNRPSCFMDGWPMDAAKLSPRADWCWDRGAACADAKDADSRDRQETHTPGCLGCLRRQRAMLIEAGKIEPYERRKGRAA